MCSELIGLPTYWPDNIISSSFPDRSSAFSTQSLLLVLSSKLSCPQVISSPVSNSRNELVVSCTRILSIGDYVLDVDQL